jgi:hypothetical protein
MSLSVAAAPKKRNRLTSKGYEDFDTALWRIAEAQHPISVRGLYYQAEVAGLVEKTEKGYGLVQRRCLLMRRQYSECGLFPYWWITDNSRMVWTLDRYDDTSEFMSGVAELYRRNYWATEDVRVEVWIEKEALSGVIYNTVVREWGVDLYVQKGFSSASYIYSAAETIKRIGKPTHIYVLSDFDPSGKCSLAKIKPELKRHLGSEIPIWVHDLAVTPAQIKKWKLPTRPTKTKNNSHYARFKAEYGDLAQTSCELDAIPPNELRAMVGNAIERHWSNKHTLEQLKVTEEQERQTIAAMSL